MEEVELFLQNYESCKFFCCTEHWKTESQLVNYGVSNFQLLTSFCRQRENSHGGSAIFVSRDFTECKAREDIKSFSVSEVFECCGGEFKHDGFTYIVISLYRPPGPDLDLFLSKLDELIHSIINENVYIFLLGDFNIDFLSSSQAKKQILTLFLTFNLKLQIFEPTRITSRSATCIDNIVTNYSRESESHVLHSLISDHTAQIIELDLKINSHKKIRYRNFNNENKLFFKESLSNMNWKTIYDAPNQEVDKQWHTFFNILMNEYNRFFPLKERFLKHGAKRNKIVMTPEILECKRQLDILYMLKNINDLSKENYNKKKKEYDQLLIKAKQSNCSERIRNSDNKSKSVWAIVNEVKGKTQNNTGISVKDDVCNVADNFNSYFATAAAKLLQQLENIPFSSNIVRFDTEMENILVDSNELAECVKGFKNKHSSDQDEVSMSLIKFVFDVIAEPLRHIINNSLQFGVFPNQLKVARVIPIFKKGDQSCVENYRPISMLSPFSKVFEKIMGNRIINFMNKTKQLTYSQHAYQKSRSTQTAIFQFINQINSILESGHIPLGLFFDLSKAYDTLDYVILLEKLDLYGIRGMPLKWVKSYLMNREQFVSIKSGDKVLTSNKIEIGLEIPQGSVLGPLLFILFVNDIDHMILDDSCCKLTVYADDTSILVEGENMSDLKLRMYDVYMNGKNWFTKNRLVLNSEKTQSLLFKTSRSRIDTPESFDVNNIKVTCNGTFKLLGVTLDETLSWSEHIDNVCQKLAKAIFSLRVLKKYVDLNTLKIVYHATFETHVRYGIAFYGGVPDLRKIFILQKKALRILLGMSIRESCRSMFKNNKILTTYGIFIQECVLFFLKHRELFDPWKPQNAYPSRNLFYNYPKHKLKQTEFGVHYNCIKMFNSLPSKLKEINNMLLFKKELFKYLCNLEPYSMQDYLCSNV